MNMILHNNPIAVIEQGNTLADPKFLDGNQLKTFDYVVANPPFSDKRWSNGLAGDAWKFMQAQKKLVADRFANTIFRLWLEEMISKGEITTFPRSKMGMLYGTDNRGRRFLNRNFNALSRCDWVGASRGQIDELKETQAAVLRISNGLSTAEDELARLGKDFRKVYRQLAREQKMRESLGLTFMATDPATMAAMNALSATPTDEPAPRNA